MIFYLQVFQVIFILNVNPERVLRYSPFSINLIEK